MAEKVTSATQPPYPFPDGDEAVGAAAWAQSNGSIAAYEQLCREHERGEIDLLAPPPATPEEAASQKEALAERAAAYQEKQAAEQEAAQQRAAAVLAGTITQPGTVSSGQPQQTQSGTGTAGGDAA